MSKTLSAEFEFEIGAVVCHKADRHGDAPQCLMVVEQVANRCHGGTQTHYQVRAFAPDGVFSIQLCLLASIEVCAYPTEAELAARKAARTEAYRKAMKERQAREEG